MSHYLMTAIIAAAGVVAVALTVIAWAVGRDEVGGPGEGLFSSEQEDAAHAAPTTPARPAATTDRAGTVA